MADIPHLAFPFERGPDGKVAVVEQDTDEHVMACENVIVRCPVGFRTERPEFGWPFPEFQNAPIDTDALQAALERFEPRSRVTATEYADVADQAVRNITVEVEVMSGG
jgi:phage baseplate assembly protein W